MFLGDSPQFPQAPVELESLSWTESPQKLHGHLSHHGPSSPLPSATISFPFLFHPGLALGSWSGANPAHPLVQAEPGRVRGFGGIRMGFPDGPSSGKEQRMLGSVPEARTLLGEVKVSTTEVSHHPPSPPKVGLGA